MPGRGLEATVHTPVLRAGRATTWTRRHPIPMKQTRRSQSPFFKNNGDKPLGAGGGGGGKCHHPAEQRRCGTRRRSLDWNGMSVTAITSSLCPALRPWTVISPEPGLLLCETAQSPRCFRRGCAGTKDMRTCALRNAKALNCTLAWLFLPA